ncbi:hypothetical protein E3Q18_02479 [Wallemia mellicola]|nr:hypothetical protein E3Q18_02479 [Wallemia mellicola]TIC10105.1 hypothetical protein E3Q14_02990 [Wallemia mellicola]
MSYKSSANDVPLGSRRKYGNNPPFEEERGRSEKRMREMPPPAQPDQPRKRKSRWGDSKDSGAVLPTAIYNANASQKSLECYAAQMRIEEINHKLRTGNIVPPEAERSPSPPPSYDSWGKRVNTRDQRYKLKLERERIKLIDKVMKMDPSYRPPSDYNQARRSTRPTEKVYIPTHDFPEVNFFGLLVGPRGNSLKSMERQSGAKISIRGKGSVKEGKGRPDSMDASSDEDLHCVVSADSEEKVRKCVRLINKVIETAASTPEGENDHKRNQLRELASLNGTLRDDEGQICQSCGAAGHRRWECPEGENITTQIKCSLCGQSGHLSSDCTVNPGQAAQIKGATNAPGFDSEYASLMAELGEGGGASKGMIEASSAQTVPGSQMSYVEKWQSEGKNLPPWRNPEIWASANAQTGGGYGGAVSYDQNAFNQGYSYDQSYDDSTTPRRPIDKLIIGGPLKNSFVHLSHNDNTEKENNDSPVVQNSISIREAQLRALNNHQQEQSEEQQEQQKNQQSDDGILPRSASSVGRLASVRRKPVPSINPVSGDIVPSSSAMQVNSTASTNATYASADFAPSIPVAAAAQ